MLISNSASFLKRHWHVCKLIMMSFRKTLKYWRSCYDVRWILAAYTQNSETEPKVFKIRIPFAQLVFICFSCGDINLGEHRLKSLHLVT